MDIIKPPELFYIPFKINLQERVLSHFTDFSISDEVDKCVGM